MEEITVNDTQIGGEHYQTEFQHWDLISKHDLGYLEGCATKYICRWRQKNGVQDLHKARHYLLKIEALHLQDDRFNKAHIRIPTIESFAKANDLTDLEKKTIMIICRWRNAGHLKAALSSLNELIEEADGAE